MQCVLCAVAVRFVSATLIGNVTGREFYPSSHYILGGFVGPRVGLDVADSDKFYGILECDVMVDV
jgi:hypothetical protein